MKKNKSLLILSLFVTLSSFANASEPEKRERHEKIAKMEEHVSKLLADRVTIKNDYASSGLSAINAKVEHDILARESLLFPAEELYGDTWESSRVNPFVGGVTANYPDSCEIDCSSFQFPISSDVRITSKFGPRGRRMHNGTDLKVYIGDTICAAFEGRVRMCAYERKGYGNYIVIRHPNGLETIYGHLSGFIAEEGDIVRAGQPIGLGGNTGRSTGSHLHFETRFLGQPFNPASIIDFDNKEMHQDHFVMRNIYVKGRYSNIYTSSTEQIIMHRIRSGESLGVIARKYGTTVTELCRLNGIRSTSTIYPGQSLRCGVAPASKPKTTAGETTEEKKEQPVASTAAAPAEKKIVVNPKVVAPVAANDDTIYHTLKQGDTLSELAVQYGTTVSKLCELNGITRNTTIRAGKKIRCTE